jgi:hypothetical protein
MENCIPINDLSVLPDAFLHWHRKYQEKEGAFLNLRSEPAFQLYYGFEKEWHAWVFIPMDNIDPLVNMFDESGLDLSYG